MGKDDEKPYLLDERDVREAARRRIIVNPTAAIAKGYAPDAATLERVRGIQKRNLALLKRHGVPVTIGMDSYGTSAWPEAEYLLTLGVYSLPELLTLWWTTTPQAIFPGRKIGHLREGYEASFLVTRRNPLERLEYLKELTLRVKQGCLLG